MITAMRMAALFTLAFLLAPYLGAQSAGNLPTTLRYYLR